MNVKLVLIVLLALNSQFALSKNCEDDSLKVHMNCLTEEVMRLSEKIKELELKPSVKGEKGVKGTEGPKGVSGPQGLKGDKGTQGVRGLRGYTGKISLANLGFKTLAILSVKNGKVEYGTNGVEYNAVTGIVSFPNPSDLKVVPIISDFGDGGHYMTTTHFLRSGSVSRNNFQVWRSPLDTGDRNSAPGSFTAIAFGI